MSLRFPSAISITTPLRAQAPLLVRAEERAKHVFGVDGPTEATAAALALRRSKIWELGQTLHCSIIGTCLSNAELRRVLERVNARGIDTADEHEIHMLGVMLAGRPQAGAKLLQKALDRRHGLAIKHFSRAKDEDAVRSLWEDAVRQGDIPGAYWAALTHPAATEAVVKEAFGHVHMLSHLVGAANRADIRRLQRLETENAELIAKTERQQKQLQDGFAARDQKIRELEALFARRLEETAGTEPRRDDIDEGHALRNTVRDINKKLVQYAAKQEHLEARLRAAQDAVQQKNIALSRAVIERDALRAELQVIERRLDDLVGPLPDKAELPVDLSGLTVLYVGGRPHQVPQLSALAGRVQAQFLHHDGGIDDNLAILPNLLGRAGLVLFPVDCVSHKAVETIKRLCRQSEKRYVPLRTASLTCFLSALSAAGSSAPVRYPAV